MKVIRGNIYDYPKYYDLVYGSDWRAEFNFLEECFDRHVDHVVESVFEPACGTGRLLYRFAKAGYRASGNDLNERSIHYCNRRLQRHGLKPGTFVGDMTDFQLDQPVDSAFNMINSFRHLLTAEMARNHLKCMARSIRSGGIYVMGLHLSPANGKACESESWSATRGHLTVNSSLWLDERNLDERYEAFNMTFDVYTPTEQFRIEDQVRFRTYNLKQFLELLSEISQLTVEAVYDFSYDTEAPITWTDNHEDVVVVLKVSG